MVNYIIVALQCNISLAPNIRYMCDQHIRIQTLWPQY